MSSIKYDSVEEYFRKEYPELVPYLKNGGGFWPTIRDNTISGQMLATDVEFERQRIFSRYSATYAACIAILAGRAAGKITSPG